MRLPRGETQGTYSHGNTFWIETELFCYRRWGGFNYRRRGYLNRGNRRFGYGGFRNRNRWGQGRGRGGRFNRGRGGRGRRQQGPPPSREQLDKEIDSYMAGTKGVLDKELDDYMMEAANV